MGPWEVSTYGHEYATAPWPLHTVAFALLAAFVALAVAVLPPARAKQERPLAGLGLLAFSTFVFGVAYVAMPVASWWFLTDDPLFGGGEARTYVVFRRLLGLEIGWAVVAAIVVFFALVLAWRRRLEPRFARAAVLVAVASLGASAVVAGHATLLVQVDCLPRFDREGHGYVHVGRERTLSVRVACGAQYEPPPPVEVVATAPGELTVHLEKAYPFVHVERTLVLRAEAEAGPERLQIREGNAWTYVRSQVSRMTSAFVERGRDERREEVRIAIGEARVDAGLRIFPLEVHAPETDEPTRLDVVGWGGELRRFDDGQLETLLAPGGLDEPTNEYLLPGVCQGEPPAGAPRAPAECRVPVNTIAGLGATMMRILTIGAATYVPGRETFRLESAAWGPEGGAEIPIVPAPPR